MAITLSTAGAPFVLPQGLRWADEFGWTPVSEETEYSLTGALLIQRGTRQTGRPLTLAGGKNWAWLSRTDLLTLQALLDAPESRVLVLHDGRQIPVLPRRDSTGPLTASPLPIVRDSGPADPSASTTYVLDELRFTIVGDIV